MSYIKYSNTILMASESFIFSKTAFVSNE